MARRRPDGTAAPYQALYRRYRPQRFADVLGQDHVTRALRHAVRDDKVAHAYLFSGPRGTGKTSTARILAMALNCEHPRDGEPDGTCPSCVAIRQGSSLDVQELDSATNRGIDEMRDLLGRVALGTPGRWKVYIIDEVHQMTSAAASALLKTLEEPPGHVIFVLATTDPQKVLPTIRSRTQHFEFRLLGADVLASLLRDVNDRAALGVAPEAIDLVVRRGHGSARDALSALDQVAAAGTVDDEATILDRRRRRPRRSRPGPGAARGRRGHLAGRDPRRLGTELLEQLRDGFLATQARSLVLLADDAVAAVEAQARRLGTAGAGAGHGGARPGPHRHAGRPRSPHHAGGGAGAPVRRRRRRQPRPPCSPASSDWNGWSAKEARKPPLPSLRSAPTRRLTARTSTSAGRNATAGHGRRHSVRPRRPSPARASGADVGGPEPSGSGAPRPGPDAAPAAPVGDPSAGASPVPAATPAAAHPGRRAARPRCPPGRS